MSKEIWPPPETQLKNFREALEKTKLPHEVDVEGGTVEVQFSKKEPGYLRTLTRLNRVLGQLRENGKLSLETTYFRADSAPGTEFIIFHIPQGD